MSEITIPVGISNFEEIQKNGYYYVDKTCLIKTLLKTAGTKVTLITRPRRFGKTLGMSMLANFFDIRKDSKRLFQNLHISSDAALCEKWQNQWPTIFLTLKNVDGLDFESAYAMLVSTVTDLYQNHLYLLNSDTISDYDKHAMERILKGTASLADVKNSLFLLTKLMHLYYGKPVILLIDEYDVPVAKANSHGYYEEMLDTMKGIMQALKDNSFLQFAVITGCLKIAKESIFTGTNNFISDTIADSRLDEYFGFTQVEVDDILRKMHLSSGAENMKDWYDGYHFGNVDVYCPWDVMNYLLDLQKEPSASPSSYWKNTSDNAIVRSFIDYAGSSITQKLETLISGGYIIQRIDENLTYVYLLSSEENLWSILYLTGYLTRKREQNLTSVLPEGMVALASPNTEIKTIFEDTVIKWFDDSARTWNRQQLFAAVWQGDAEKITDEMGKMLRRTIRYHDYKEDFYHAFLAGIFTGAGYMVDSNKEHGEGRSDVAVYDPVNSRVAVFEVKYAKKLEDMGSGCRDALAQIDNKMYAERYEDDYDQVLCYGISFFKKRCLVKRKV